MNWETFKSGSFDPLFKEPNHTFLFKSSRKGQEQDDKKRMIQFWSKPNKFFNNSCLKN